MTRPLRFSRPLNARAGLAALLVIPGILCSIVVRGGVLPPGCSTDTTLCLSGGRFQVSATWTGSGGTPTAGHAVLLTPETGYFWFLESGNVEVAVKVLNGCSVNDRYWVFAAGLTNVLVNWEVLDTQTGVSFTQVNPQGTPFAPVQATTAFPTACPLRFPFST